jgi:hypothetical protein
MGDRQGQSQLTEPSLGVPVCAASRRRARSRVTFRRVPDARRLPLVALIGCGLGCAPSLATMQPAHVAPRGHIQATAGIEIGVPKGGVDAVVDSGRALADAAQSGTLTDEQKWQLFDAAVNLVASPPSASQHFAIAYTAIERTEASLRYVGGGWRLGARYQILSHAEAPLDLVVGLGASRSTTPIPLGDILPVVKIEDFTRWTFDLPILAGTSRDWFRVWFGPRLLYTRFHTRMRLDLYADEVQMASFEGSAFYYGGQVGAAIGYRKVFFGVELTMAGLTGSATATTMLAIPTRKTELSGFVTYPAFGLMGEF